MVDFAKPFVNEVVKNMEKSSEYNDMELKEELIKLWAFYVCVIYSYNLTKWIVGIYYIGRKKNLLVFYNAANIYLTNVVFWHRTPK